jgi:sterol desaturase/sphingolipid hydroxylase (fatty acid hydroxylase superfamily)
MTLASAFDAEGWLRLVIFATAFLVLALGELNAPRHRWPAVRKARWATNLGLIILGGILIRVLSPLSGVAAGAVAEDRAWGILGIWGIAGTPVGVIAAVVALDLAIYGQHVAMHRVGFLWRVHRVHHADTAVDVSTGLRFHPLEFLLSAGWKVVVVLLLGASVAAVVTFEILLNVTSMFSHANLQLPGTLDRLARWLLVTPDMHRVHHSVVPSEFNRNFGFALPWWDRLCGTYRDQPAAGHETMALGLEAIPASRAQRFGAMLVEPFQVSSGGRPNQSEETPWRQP